MSNLKTQILDAFENLNLKVEDVKDPHVHRKFIHNFLTTKEVRHIPQDKKDEMFNWKPSILFPDYQEFYESSDDTLPEKDYTKVTDAYELCELFAASKRLRVTPDYLRYIKHSKNGYVVNIYDVASAMISTNIWNFTDCAKEREAFNAGKIPEADLYVPESIKYSVLDEKVYLDFFLIDSCRNDLTALVINLPYEYYSLQNLKGSIFTWDLKNQKYQIGGKDLKAINSDLEYYAKNGFGEPLVFRIDEGCLTPIDNDTAIKLFLATYLALPTIPAVLYMSDEEVTKNRTYDELFDIVYNNYWDSQDALDMINNICKPYFFFEAVAGSQSRSFLQVGQETFAKNQYPSVNNINDPNIAVINRHIDPSIPAEQILLPMNEEEMTAKMEAANQKLLDEINEKVRKENEEIAKKILAGEY